MAIQHHGNFVLQERSKHIWSICCLFGERVCMVNETGITVGHVPRKISAVCYMFIQRGGSISCQVTGSRRYSYDLPQGGLELPWCLTFTGPSKIVKKVQKLLDKQPAMMVKKTDSEQLNKKPNIANNHDSLEDMAQLSENEIWVTYQSHKLSNVDKATIKNGDTNWQAYSFLPNDGKNTIFINRRFRMYISLIKTTGKKNSIWASSDSCKELC